MNICERFKLNNFKGVFMRDELKNNCSAHESPVAKNEYPILNTDHSSGNGIHWVSLYIKNNIQKSRTFKYIE